MADIGPKRIADFIEPFRVEPGRRVRLPRDFDPAGPRQPDQGRGQGRSSRQGIELLAEYQTRLAAQDTYGVRRRPPGDGRGRQGRHHPPRHERRQPAGRPGQQLQDPFERGPRPRLPVALRQEAARSAATSASSTAPTTRRSSSSASTRRSSPARRCPPKLEGPRHLEAALPRDQRLGALPDRPGLSDRQDLPEPEQGGAAAPVPGAHRRAEKNWKFSANDAKERVVWDDYQKAFSDVLSNTSTEWAPWYVIPADDKPFARVAAAGVLANALIEIDPQFPRSRARPARRSRRPRSTSRARRPRASAPDPIEAELAEQGEPEKAGARAVEAQRSGRRASREGGGSR